MSTTPLPAPQTDGAALAFVEEYGLYIERKGRLPRMAGRILAQLLITDEPHLSQADLCRHLQASTGAVSGMLRLLIEAGFVKRISVPGVRKDLYRPADDRWGGSLLHGGEDAQEVAGVAELGAAAGAEVGPRAQERLAEMRHLAVNPQQHGRGLVESWEAYKRGRGA